MPHWLTSLWTNFWFLCTYLLCEFVLSYSMNHDLLLCKHVFYSLILWFHPILILWIIDLLLCEHILGFIEVPSAGDQVVLPAVPHTPPPLPHVVGILTGLLQQLYQIIFVVVVANICLQDQNKSSMKIYNFFFHNFFFYINIIFLNLSVRHFVTINQKNITL